MLRGCKSLCKVISARQLALVYGMAPIALPMTPPQPGGKENRVESCYLLLQSSVVSLSGIVACFYLNCIWKSSTTVPCFTRKVKILETCEHHLGHCKKNQTGTSAASCHGPAATPLQPTLPNTLPSRPSLAQGSTRPMRKVLNGLFQHTVPLSWTQTCSRNTGQIYD